jgi:hypothetical protein
LLQLQFPVRTLEVQAMTDPSGSPLTSVVLAAHQRIGRLVSAAEEFHGPQAAGRERWSAASTVLSTHLAAMERAVYPAAVKHASGGRGHVAGQLRAARAVALAIRDLEHQLYGDFFAPQRSVALSQEAVRPVLDDYLQGERELVQNLVDGLTGSQERSVAQRLTVAQEIGASRPHPHVPLRWPLSAVAFWFNRNWDALLDVLDNRIAAESRPRQTVPVGRWGHYLTGLPLSQQPPQVPHPRAQMRQPDRQAERPGDAP